MLGVLVTTLVIATAPRAILEDRMNPKLWGHAHNICGVNPSNVFGP